MSVDFANLKSITAKEVSYHDGGATLNGKDVSEEDKKLYQKDLWVVIHGLVVDVTDFLPKHPGGPDAFKPHAGQDATAAFEDFYHSNSSREMLKPMIVGRLAEYTGDIEACFKGPSNDTSQNLGVMVAAAVALAAAAYYMFF